MNLINDVYPASDLAEITYLFCKGITLARTDRQGQRVVFFFEGYDTCKRLISDISYGRDMVRLTTALQEIRRARGIMHQV